jgi:hypothetical protein
MVSATQCFTPISIAEDYTLAHHRFKNISHSAEEMVAMEFRSRPHVSRCLKAHRLLSESKHSMDEGTQFGVIDILWRPRGVVMMKAVCILDEFLEFLCILRT